MESTYSSDPETAPVRIHPYPKPPASDTGRRPPAEEARVASSAASSVRYEDFFGDDEGASRSA
jgi:hypothetical protein